MALHHPRYTARNPICWCLTSYYVVADSERCDYFIMSGEATTVCNQYQPVPISQLPTTYLCPCGVVSDFLVPAAKQHTYLIENCRYHIITAPRVLTGPRYTSSVFKYHSLRIKTLSAVVWCIFIVAPRI
jgi:hypothetical protein